MRTPIGMGEQSGGVYYFKEALEGNQVHMVNTVNLWHKRLGHPSHETLPLSTNYLEVINYKNKAYVWETCHRAKQTHIHFPTSSNKAKSVFDLIHYHI